MTAFPHAQPMPSIPPKPSLAVYRKDPAPQAGEIRKVLCGRCRFYKKREQYTYGPDSQCRRFSEYATNPISGCEEPLKIADCYAHNADLKCAEFEPRRTLWGRFLDWLGK